MFRKGEDEEAAPPLHPMHPIVADLVLPPTNSQILTQAIQEMGECDARIIHLEAELEATKHRKQLAIDRKKSATEAIYKAAKDKR